MGIARDEPLDRLGERRNVPGPNNEKFDL